MQTQGRYLFAAVCSTKWEINHLLCIKQFYGKINVSAIDSQLRRLNFCTKAFKAFKEIVDDLVAPKIGIICDRWVLFTKPQ